MKKILFCVFVAAIAAVNVRAQEFTQTTTTANITASRSRIDMPGLDGNPQAIIVATPVGNAATLNPHPLGVWYTNNKWHIFNTNHFNMPVGASYKLQVFMSPGANCFLYVIPQADDMRGYSVIDNPALNGNAGAQVRILQNHAPENRPHFLSANEARALYDTGVGKWYIQNVNLSALHVRSAYNVVFTPVAGTRITPPRPIQDGPPSTFPPQLTPTTPSGNVDGDLNGAYPNPNVIGLSGRPLSNRAPAVGDTLRWNGSAWEPYTPPVSAFVNANRLLGRDIMTTEPKPGQVLKWGGGSWYPADDNVAGASTPASGAVTQAYYEVPWGQSGATLDDSKPTAKIAGLSHTIVLSKASRVVISAAVRISGNFCPVGCSDGIGVLYVRFNNGPTPYANTDFFVPHGRTISTSVGNFVRELEPGTHTIDFWVSHTNGTSAFNAGPNFSTILVIPLN